MTGRVQVVAIVNRTPDSFHDQGATFGFAAALEAAVAAEQAGAAWVDIGGCPIGRAHEVPEDVERERVVPLIAYLTGSGFTTPIMVDTFRASVARAAIAAGAAGINDTSGLYDPAMAGVAAEGAATLVLTASRTWPSTDRHRPAYADVVAEVRGELMALAKLATAAGVHSDRLIVDPGHGLWKTTAESLAVTRHLGAISVWPYPVMVAISNKGFVRDVVGPDQLLAGSLAATVLAVQTGARYVRAHDVAATVAAVQMTEAVLGVNPPGRDQTNMARTSEVRA